MTPAEEADYQEYKISQEMGGRTTRKFMERLLLEQSLPPIDTPERRATFERVKELKIKLDKSL